MNSTTSRWLLVTSMVRLSLQTTSSRSSIAQYLQPDKHVQSLTSMNSMKIYSVKDTHSSVPYAFIAIGADKRNHTKPVSKELIWKDRCVGVDLYHVNCCIVSKHCRNNIVSMKCAPTVGMSAMTTLRMEFANLQFTHEWTSIIEERYNVRKVDILKYKVHSILLQFTYPHDRLRVLVLHGSVESLQWHGRETKYTIQTSIHSKTPVTANSESGHHLPVFIADVNNHLSPCFSSLQCK